MTIASPASGVESQPTLSPLSLPEVPRAPRGAPRGCGDTGPSTDGPPREAEHDEETAMRLAS